MFDLAFRFVARKFAIPLLQFLRRPLLARTMRAASRLLGVRTPPPRGAFETALEWAAQPGGDGRKYVEIYPASEVRRQPPRSIHEDLPSVFREALLHANPSVFLATVPGGRVLGRYGSVISGDDFLLGDLSHEWFFKPAQHPLRFRFSLPEPKVLRGISATLASPSGWNYFHWLLNALPRAGILEKAGWDLGAIDWFILNEGDARYHEETLDGLGIVKEKRLRVGRGSHFRCAQLLAPSLPADVPAETPEIGRAHV